MGTFDLLFGSPWDFPIRGFGCEPGMQAAMSEQQLRARELALAPLMANSQQTNYEALRNAFRAQEAWDDSTVNQRYHDFCARLREAKKRAGMK